MMRSWISADCTAEPPGESISTTTPTASSELKARNSARFSDSALERVFDAIIPSTRTRAAKSPRGGPERGLSMLLMPIE